MRITFLGGADEVGASSLLLEIGGRRLLIDAGIRPSPKARWGLAGDQLPDLSQVDAAGGVDAILVTHAHTDHTGALELVTERYACPVYATPPTIALTRVLHADSRRIMQSRLDEEGELPLFDDVAVEKLMAAFVPVAFDARLPLGGGVAATFFPAGHIAGAAMIGLESDEGRVLVTGDLSLSPQRTVDGARTPAFRPDVVILESTYGGRMHANRAAEERRLADAVAEVIAAGGKVLIPAFALGRAQEVILTLSEFRRRGSLSAPVWADGMVRSICHAYAQFPEVLPLPLQERGARFFDEHTRAVTRPDQRNALAWQPEPAIIIASSGMLAGGASVAYARALAGGPQNAILLTGYQDEESPGRRLQEMARAGTGRLRLGRDMVDVRCRLGTYSLSAHADEGQLLSLVETLDPAEVILAHGDEGARESLARRLAERGRRVRLPVIGQSLDIRFTATPAARRPVAIGAGRPLEARVLWERLAGPAGGGRFSAEELARAWWGDAERADEVEDALRGDDQHFEADPRSPGTYRARTAGQIEAQAQRRAALAARGLRPGDTVILPDAETDAPRLARVASVGADDFRAAGDPSPLGPHAILDAFPADESAGDLAAAEALAAALDPAALLRPGVPRPLDDVAASLPHVGVDPRAVRVAAALALLRAGAQRLPGAAREYLIEARASPVPGAMEPNQALAHVRAQFPPETRLRRSGYHPEQRAITVGFDFPDAVIARHPELCERLSEQTGWEVRVDPEPNQSALMAVARAAAADLGLEVARGPAILREEKRVAVTLRGESEGLDAACRAFREATGWELAVTFATPGLAVAPPLLTATPPGDRWEVNAAYAEIRAALAGSTLYRTSLVGEAILLSFISPQVGERHRAAIEALSRRIGWPLQVNPRPNQGAILEVARRLAADAGWEVLKGPGLRAAQSTVEVQLASPPGAESQARVAAELEAQTGCRLALGTASLPERENPGAPPPEAVVVPPGRIRLSAGQQRTDLNPAKAAKAVERARRIGRIAPPLQLRRTRDGYLLLDGLYRLHAARTLGWEQVDAVVEE
ncbi:MAG: MBL fold metallo-hydrolase [Armatimonadetes bacterium]|nr:MBL fold metallo-hydrolase [Armatimonadota bacterium]